MKPIIDNTSVKIEGKGRFNFNNRKEAESLYALLMECNHLESINKEASHKFDEITRQVIQLQMTLKIMDSELEKLKKMARGEL